MYITYSFILIFQEFSFLTRSLAFSCIYCNLASYISYIRNYKLIPISSVKIKELMSIFA